MVNICKRLLEASNVQILCNTLILMLRYCIVYTLKFFEEQFIN